MLQRVEYYHIVNNPHQANIQLTDEVNAVSNDLYICLEGNSSRFNPDRETKAALDSLYRKLAQYKKEGKF